MNQSEKTKALIKNYAQLNNVSSQEVLQIYLFERLLERLSVSKYRDNFALKGGLLISSLIGVNQRTTQDLDATVLNLKMDENTISKIVAQIISIPLGDDVIFNFNRIESIRQKDDYNNFRVHLSAMMGKINASLKIDITTGDALTPSAIEYIYTTLLDSKHISIKAYNLETLLAEKFETILCRNVATTRIRDYYDLYMLFRTGKSSIDSKTMKIAVLNTAKHRNTEYIVRDWEKICFELRNDESIYQLWKNYQNYFYFAANISFEEVLNNLFEFGAFIGI